MEQGYRSGAVCVLMATSTLAAGDEAEPPFHPSACGRHT